MEVEYKVESNHLSYHDPALEKAIEQYTSVWWPFGRRERASEKWEELHSSISSTGKVLWGDFKAEKFPMGTEHNLLVYWKKVGKSRSAFLNKLYGFNTEEREIKGVLDKWKGTKTGKSSILVPFKHKKKLMDLLKKYDVDARTIEVYTKE